MVTTEMGTKVVMYSCQSDNLTEGDKDDGIAEIQRHKKICAPGNFRKEFSSLVANGDLPRDFFRFLAAAENKLRRGLEKKKKNNANLS